MLNSTLWWLCEEPQLRCSWPGSVLGLVLSLCCGPGDTVLLRLPFPLMPVDMLTGASLPNDMPPRHAVQETPAGHASTSWSRPRQQKVWPAWVFSSGVPGLGLTSDRTKGSLITSPPPAWGISDLTWVCACECLDKHPSSEGRWNGNSDPPALPKADKPQPARSAGPCGGCLHPPWHACGLFLPETANAYRRQVMSHGLGSSSKDGLKQETFISCFSSLFSDRTD